jgi:hypothetical protein
MRGDWAPRYVARRALNRVLPHAGAEARCTWRSDLACVACGTLARENISLPGGSEWNNSLGLAPFSLATGRGIDFHPGRVLCAPDRVVRLRAVRKLLVLICLLTNISLMLIPFDSTHAHVTADHGHTHASDVHGGHSHDFDLYGDVDDDSDTDEQVVVDMKPALTSQGTLPSAFLTLWLPLACTLVLLLAVAQFCVRIIAPPRSDPRPTSRHGHWRPPLRGPPTFSIEA